MNSKTYEITGGLEVEGRYILSLELKNLSNEPLFFREGFLKRHDIRLVVSKDLAFSGVLDEISAIDDPNPGNVKIEAGKSYIQKIDLKKIFPSLQSDLNKHNLVLFWSTTAKPVGKNAPSRHFGGFFYIDKISRTSGAKD